VSGAQRRVSRSFILLLVGFIALTVVYAAVGDRTVWGECVTVWPPFLWCALALPRLVLLALRRRARELAACVALILAFLASAVEWRSLLRSRPLGPVAEGTRLRLITWNVAGQMPLEQMEPLAPDLCLLQEIGGLPPDAVQGFWKGWHWREALDPGSLSRHPIERLPTRRIGPWTDPQVLRLDLPAGRRVVLINVRLVLPSLVVAAASFERPARLFEAHVERVSQYPLLADLLRDTLRAEATRSAIVCGDFNTPGGAASLAPLARQLVDVWPSAGVGWGATMTAELPVSRIDQCWVTPDITPIVARVHRGRSDHRMLVVDLIVP
jgi:endonuclease/exonuclease/phosphatase (EEP) superfamily protein YafD